MVNNVWYDNQTLFSFIIFFIAMRRKKMIEKILLYIFMLMWIGSMVSCFTIGVLMEDRKNLEKFAILPIIIGIVTTVVIEAQVW